MTTQDYAHQGAFWLTVALLMLTAVIGFFFRGPLAHDPSASVHKVRALAYGWMGQGLVLALATYRRIGIHITHSGLSDLRIVGILGTTLVVSGVVLVALKLKKQKTFTWLVRRQLDAFAVTAIVYSLTSTHALGAGTDIFLVEYIQRGAVVRDQFVDADTADDGHPVVVPAQRCRPHVRRERVRIGGELQPGGGQRVVGHGGVTSNWSA